MANLDGSGPLCLDGISAHELVSRFGSPLFVLEQDTIIGSCQKILKAFEHPHIQVFYAMKANPNLEVLRCIHREGVGIDCCSPGEVHLAGLAGIPREDVTFTGTGVRPDEIDGLITGTHTLNLDSLSQIESLGGRLGDRGIGIRLNPGFGAGSHASNTTGGADSKLGIPIADVAEALSLAQRAGTRIRGFHVHTGSGGLDPDHFVKVTDLMFELVENFGDSIEYLDLGGGIGVPSRFTDDPFPLEIYADAVKARLDSHIKNRGPLKVFIEPGQFLVARAGWLLMTVVIRKKTPSGKTVVTTDSSFNHYLGTSLYQSYHEFVHGSDVCRKDEEIVSICGHLCNTGDSFAKDRSLPHFKIGDIIAMADAGAYGMSRGSNYNSRPLPAEVMVCKGVPRVIRRRELYEDLIRTQLDLNQTEI